MNASDALDPAWPLPCYRIAVETAAGGYGWRYVAHGYNCPEVEAQLAVSHREGLEAVPPTAAEIEAVRETLEAFNNRPRTLN